MNNNTDQDFRQFLRSTSVAMEADEALRAGPGRLIGVSPAAEAALATIQINSIFDLASSHVFAAATALLARPADRQIERHDKPIVRLASRQPHLGCQHIGRRLGVFAWMPIKKRGADALHEAPHAGEVDGDLVGKAVVQRHGPVR